MPKREQTVLIVAVYICTISTGSIQYKSTTDLWAVVFLCSTHKCPHEGAKRSVKIRSGAHVMTHSGISRPSGCRSNQASVSSRQGTNRPIKLPRAPAGQTSPRNGRSWLANKQDKSLNTHISIHKCHYFF